jgi:superfamily II DNA or RNA helicase
MSGPLPPNMITIDSIRTLSLLDLEALLDAHIPIPQQPTPEFLDSLPSDERSTVLKLCLLCWKITENWERTIIPKEFQLKAALATIMKRDSIVDVGTGSGKTLAMILPHLLFPAHVSVILSPYKRLQEQQHKDFAKFGLVAD